MKFLTVLSLLVFTFTTSAFADFRPGRVRPGATAFLNATETSGVYQNLNVMQLFLNYEDGKADPVSITFNTGSRAAVTYPIQSVHRTSCGDHFVAEPNVQSNFRVSLELVDYSNIQCRLFVANKWHVTLTLNSPNGNDGEARFEGQPEFLAVTL